MIRTYGPVCITIVRGHHTGDYAMCLTAEGYVEVIKGIKHRIQAMIS
jgi:hypothetical protein